VLIIVVQALLDILESFSQNLEVVSNSFDCSDGSSARGSSRSVKADCLLRKSIERLKVREQMLVGTENPALESIEKVRSSDDDT
jgi:hypothetical protein